MKRPTEVTILKQCLRDYRGNYVLLVPGLMLALAGYLLLFSLVVMRVPMDLSGGTLPVIVLILVVAALLLEVGLAAMSANIITKGTCKLSDWWTGILKCFWRLFGISCVLVMSIALILIITQLLFSYMQWPSIVRASYSEFFASVIFLATNVCVAAAMIDDKGVWSSIRMGWRTIRASGRVFLSFLVLHIVYGEVHVILESSYLGLANLDFTSALANSLTLPSIGYGIIQLFLLPLWFLITFRIYDNFSHCKQL
jgi:hypothetical protein